MEISQIKARQILDSRGNPTIEAEVMLNSGISASASVPSGASTGIHEALELRDNDSAKFGGKGVLKAIINVEKIISPNLIGKNPIDQKMIDDSIIKLDGTENKSNLGANAILAVSMACTKVAALSLKKPLYAHIATLFGVTITNESEFVLPVPMMNLINGGRHANNSTDFQEYMIMPSGAETFSEAIEWGSEIFHSLKKILDDSGQMTSVGDEGGFVPKVSSNTVPLDLILDAIKRVGLVPGKDVFLALDIAASEFFDKEKNLYTLTKENLSLTGIQLVDFLVEMTKKYPFLSIEDGFDEDDFESNSKFSALVGKEIQTVGDDLYVTNVKRLEKGINTKATNAILIKLNQIGTVSETIDAIQLAKKSGMKSVVSHRSGETEDTFIADFVVGSGVGQIKTGSLSRTERVAKYNRLLKIEEELGERALYNKDLRLI